MKTIIDIVLEKQTVIEKEVRRIREKTEKQNKEIIFLFLITILNLGIITLILGR